MRAAKVVRTVTATREQLANVTLPFAEEIECEGVRFTIPAGFHGDATPLLDEALNR